MLLAKIKKLWKLVTYEPVMFLYVSSFFLSLLSSQNLLLQKACFPGDTIPPPTAACPNEAAAQKVVTDVQSWQNVIVLFGPVLFLLFAGPWSDNHGKNRKPLMWLPICGQLIIDLLNLVNTYFWNWSPTVAALTQSIPAALTGWRSCLIIGVISYIGDISTIESRTIRTGVFSALYYVGNPIGGTLFGLLFDYVGFYGIFLTSLGINLAGLVYLITYVPDSDPVTLKESKLKPWEGLFDPSQAMKSVKTIFKPRSGVQRAIVLLTVLVSPLAMAPLIGEHTILLLFARYQFSWDSVEYGYYNAYKNLIVVCGSLITTRVFSRYLGISDAVLGVMGSVTQILASLGYTFASQPWEMFVFPIVNFMQGSLLAVVYSIGSKNVEDFEIAQVTSMIGIADAIYPLVNLPLYNQVYNHTFTTLTGAVFLVSAFYGCCTFIVFGSMYLLQRSQRLKEEKMKTSGMKTKSSFKFDAL